MVKDWRLQTLSFTEKSLQVVRVIVKNENYEIDT